MRAGGEEGSLPACRHTAPLTVLARFCELKRSSWQRASRPRAFISATSPPPLSAWLPLPPLPSPPSSPPPFPPPPNPSLLSPQSVFESACGRQASRKTVTSGDCYKKPGWEPCRLRGHGSAAGHQNKPSATAQPAGQMF